jgi:hypothetical protein
MDTVIWEDSERPQREIYFEVNKAFADYLSPNPHTFLVACSVPALHYSEQRIAIDEAIYPELRTELLINMGWLRHWSGSKRR